MSLAIRCGRDVDTARMASCGEPLVLSDHVSIRESFAGVRCIRSGGLCAGREIFFIIPKTVPKLSLLHRDSAGSTDYNSLPTSNNIVCVLRPGRPSSCFTLWVAQQSEAT